MAEDDKSSKRTTLSRLPDDSEHGPATTPLPAAAEPTADAAAPEVEARSVLLSIDSSGRPGAGLKLRDLDDDEPLPELQMGPEKYTILKELGAGGMGKVYLAYDQDLRRRVALKMVRNLASEKVRRFLEEAQVTGVTAARFTGVDPEIRKLAD